MQMQKWQNLVLHPITGGYDVSKAADQIDNNKSPHLENMIFNRGRLETDYGYAVFGANIRGNPRKIFHFDRKSGAVEVLLFTDTTAYKWAQDEWQYIAGAVETLADGGEPAGETDIVVDAIAGFSNGDYIGLILDNGSEHKTTINGVPAGTTIVITDGIPAGRTLADNARVLLPVAFTGDKPDQPTMAVFPAGDVMYYTNGNDNVKIYDGTTLEDDANLIAAVTTNARAKVVRVHNNKVVLYHTYENGVLYPVRVRWCATGDYTDWTTANDAGYEDLYQSADHIVAAELLGPYVIVYREWSMMRQEYVGSTALIYNFERTVGLDGAASTESVISRGNYHIVFGSQGIYVYDGGYELIPFGEEIWEKLFGYVSELNVEYKGLTYAFYNRPLKEYWFLVVGGSNVWPSILWKYSITNKAWTRRIFNDTIISCTHVELSSGETWSSSTGNWDDNEWLISWSSLALAVGQPNILLAGFDSDNDPQIFQYASAYSQDISTYIGGEYWTKEIYAEEGFIRFNKIIIHAAGIINIYYSKDGGVSWTNIVEGSVGVTAAIGHVLIEDGSFFLLETGASLLEEAEATAGAIDEEDYITLSVWEQIIFERIMFKFTSDTAFGLGRVLIQYQVESPWGG